MRMPPPGSGGQPMRPQVQQPRVQQPKVQPRAGGRPVMQTFPSRPMTQPAVGTPFNKPTGPQVQPPMGGFGGPIQPKTMPPAGGFGGPMQPQVQPPMGGFGPDINNFGGKPPQQPSMGQSALGGQQNPPFNLMQRFQQMQQMMPQGGFGGQQPPMQPGQLFGIAGGIGMPPQLMGGGNPMQDQYQAFMNQQQQPLQQQGQQLGGQPPMDQPMDRQKQPAPQGYTPDPRTMRTQPPAPPGMAMGGPVGMAPPNPYEQQVGQEDPRMQAMRNMQQMNFGG